MTPAGTLPALVMTALLSACATSPGGPGHANSPPMIQEQVSFAAGGTMTTAPGTFDARKPMAPDGQTYRGDHAYAFISAELD